ncbi:MAG: hypothetical protein HRT88_01930 [Lentisphaeraceae bacterium]|nr:hypothetical protein [Lentisphaeraceae bacterium]
MPLFLLLLKITSGTEYISRERTAKIKVTEVHNMQRNTDGVDHGPALPLSCPMCQHCGFNLIEKKGLRSTNWVHVLISLLTMEPPGWFLRCISCSYEQYVPYEDLAEMVKFNHDARDCQCGKLSDEKYWARVCSCQVKCVVELKKRARLWECLECECDNPPSFEICWNCGANSEEQRIVELKMGSDA